MEGTMHRYLSTVIFCSIFYFCQSTDITYTTKYDGVDLNEVLSNDRLLNGYISCLLDLGPCSPDGKELKNNLPDAIDNDCEKCSVKQREGSEKVMHYIIDNKPDDWIKLEKKYNPDGSYRKNYLASKSNSGESTVNSKEEEKNEKST